MKGRKAVCREKRKRMQTHGAHNYKKSEQHRKAKLVKGVRRRVAIEIREIPQKGRHPQAARAEMCQTLREELHLRRR